MAYEHPGLSAEAEILLRCSRTRIDTKGIERLRFLLRQEINWRYLIQTALRHGVMPLLYSSLRAGCPESVPEAYLNQLRDHFRANVQHSFFLTAELLNLLELFESHEIRAIPFKGPVLAAFVYRDLALRQFSDLDIIVQREDIFRAAKLLVSQGYRSTSFNGSLKSGEGSESDPDHEEAAYFAPRYYTFLHQVRRTRVDLQWRVAESYFSFPLDRNFVWERLVSVPIAGGKVLTFAPMDLLIILCVHGSKHRWENLQWICDVAELIRVYGEEIDWQKLRQEASRQGAERMLGLGLVLAHEFLGIAFPEEISNEIHIDSKMKSMARQTSDRLFAPVDRTAGDFKRVCFYLGIKDRWRDRWQFCVTYLSQCLHAVLTPTSIERKAMPLPAPLFFLYYLLRTLRLTVKYGSLPLACIYRGKSRR